MREIKFRAWFDRDKIMFYNVGYHPTILEFHEDHENNGEITVCPMANGYHIMQYTGLKDKNGKEIYEGDIIKHGESIRFCEYNTSNFWLTRLNKTETILLSFVWKGCEVIGNVHQNIELLNHYETK